jgi:hypothetical protein
MNKKPTRRERAEEMAATKKDWKNFQIWIGAKLINTECLPMQRLGNNLILWADEGYEGYTDFEILCQEIYWENYVEDKHRDDNDWWEWDGKEVVADWAMNTIPGLCPDEVFEALRDKWSLER